MGLRQKAISGIKWNGLSMAITVTLRFTTMAILARLLSPSDFGLMGMISVVTALAQSFADMGLGAAIIQRQNVPRTHLSSIFWTNVLTGIFLFLCILLARPLAVLYFKQPQLTTYLIIAAGIFLIAPWGAVFAALLTKELRFETLAKIDTTNTIISSFSAVAFALSSFGVLSLILSELLASLVNIIILFLLFRKIWLPQLHFQLREVRNYLGFGIYQTGERVLNYFTANVDYIIIGRFLGPASLGFYTLAYNLMTFPLHKINPIVTRVAYPAFSKLQQDNVKIREGYCKIINYITAVSFPMLAGMFVVAPEFVRFVYGAQWEPSIIVLQIFCVVGAFKSLGNPVGSVLLAKGRADIAFYWNVFTVIVVSVAVMLCVSWGITGVAYAIMILQLPFFLIIQPITNRLIDLRSRQYFYAIRSPLICSLIMAAFIAPLNIYLSSLSILPSLSITIAIGASIYIVSYYLYDNAFFSELISIIRGI